MLHRGAGTSRVPVRPAATEPSGAVLGPAAASPQRGDKSLSILLVSPIGLQNTRNNYMEHNKTNTCSSHLLAPSNNNYYYSFLFQFCLQPRGEQRLMLPGSGGMASCVVFFYDQSGIPLCSWLLNPGTRREWEHGIVSCDKHGTRCRHLLHREPTRTLSNKAAPALPLCMPTAVRTRAVLV